MYIDVASAYVLVGFMLDNAIKLLERYTPITRRGTILTTQLILSHFNISPSTIFYDILLTRGRRPYQTKNWAPIAWCLQSHTHTHTHTELNTRWHGFSHAACRPRIQFLTLQLRNSSLSSCHLAAIRSRYFDARNYNAILFHCIQPAHSAHSVCVCVCD